MELPTLPFAVTSFHPCLCLDTTAHGANYSQFLSVFDKNYLSLMIVLPFIGGARVQLASESGV